VKIGIDITHLDDFEQFDEASVDLVFTRAEWADVDGDPNHLARKAGRFAAKEAVLKVLGCGLGDISLVDIEILSAENGEPRVRLSGRALEWFQTLSLDQLELSISHHREYAVAVAVATPK
jgi:phosphopantetheine--protein transferase-like protein